MTSVRTNIKMEVTVAAVISLSKERERATYGKYKAANVRTMYALW